MVPMRRLSVPLVAAVLTALLLAACGSTSSDPVKVKGTGYTFTTPSGWEDLTGDSDKIADALGEAGADVTAKDIGASYDAIVSDTDSSGDFKTNLNVVTQSGLPAGLDSKKVATQSAQTLADPSQTGQFLPDGFTINFDGSAPKKTDLDGEVAYEISYGAKVKSTELKAEQVYVVHDGSAYVLTFTAAADSFGKDSSAFESMRRSWKFD
jgi:hypothetical protein